MATSSRARKGALLLIKELQKPEYRYLLEKIDLVIIPQMNPDGAEADRRLNGNKMDLNRNHLILTEPETIGLHNLFNKYLFDVTMDVHEYWPFGKTWRNFGYRANNDEQIGILTNINIANEIREISNREYLPYIKSYLNKRGFSYFEYSPGGPPEADYIRHSTFDINDGRQSFGIQCSFSFIQEGLNGEDSSLTNIKHRAEGQMTGMLGLIEYAYNHKDEIKSIVEKERNNLITGKADNKVAVQLDHVSDGSKLKLPLFSYKSLKDTFITVTNYRPVVKAISEVEKPKGYLVPKSLKDIIAWADRHSLEYSNYKKDKNEKISQYFVAEIDSIDFEGDMTVNPKVELKEAGNSINEEEYIYIPTNQLRSNMIVIALEPKSELGLAAYKNFEYLLKKGTEYPVLRVENK